MKIVLLTNTFTPHVGGVARSVEAFTEAYRSRGHRVIVVAPEFSGQPRGELDVFRVPALQNFNASDFSFALPVPTGLTETLEDLKPDIIHSQHPFLLGNTAVRLSRYLDLPLVFTHHTLYEQYTHYVPGNLPLFKRFIIELATRYANLSDLVFAPSESIADILLQRGVSTRVEVVPTGVKVENFSGGDGAGLRARRGIPADAFVVGHLGRLAPEKNLDFLARAAVDFLKRHDNAWFLVVGNGPSEQRIRDIFEQAGLGARLCFAGVLQHRALADALAAMDLFAFASRSETQGMVLIEAMAAGLPVVALEAPGVREVVRDGDNGRLVQQQDLQAFGDALDWVARLGPGEREALVGGARRRAEEYSMARCADKALAQFERLCGQGADPAHEEVNGWEQVMARLRAEWEIIKSVTHASDEALSETWFGEKQQEGQ